MTNNFDIISNLNFSCVIRHIYVYFGMSDYITNFHKVSSTTNMLSHFTTGSQSVIQTIFSSVSSPSMNKQSSIVFAK